MSATQIFLASTPFGALTLAAALDAGLLGDGKARRVLVVSNNAAIPELTPGLTAQPGWETLGRRFDALIDWNAEIAPLHPSGWQPREEELPLYERWLRDRWGLAGHDVELVVESVAVAPARTLCALFFDAPITVYSDGLMSYGPTRSALPPGVGSRIDRLLHLDLVPGLTPQLLREYGVPSTTIPDAAFRKVLDELTDAVRPALTAPDGGGIPEGTPLVVGQYLAALEILTAQEEDDLHVAMLRGVVARGFSTVLFKPHPASPVRATERLADEARRLGARLVVVDQPVPAEAWCAAVRPALIVGCFSTAQITAARYYGVPAATVGAAALLDRLTPYENSNRVPVTIVDATVPALSADGSLTNPTFPPNAALPANAASPAEAARPGETARPAEAARPGETARPAEAARPGEAARPALTAHPPQPGTARPAQPKPGPALEPLLAAVAYAMQAATRPDLRAQAVHFLNDHWQPTQRYFKRRRLTSLALPGGLPSSDHPLVTAALPRTSRRRRLATAALRQVDRLRD